MSERLDSVLMLMAHESNKPVDSSTVAITKVLYSLYFNCQTYIQHTVTDSKMFISFTVDHERERTCV